MGKNISDRGFTLIELLVVVAIVGVLSAIGISSFSEYKQRAYIAASQTLMSNTKPDMEAYVTDPDHVKGKTGGRYWHPNSAAPTGWGLDLLPTVRVSKNYYTYGRIDTCADPSQDQYVIAVQPLQATKRIVHINYCNGRQYNYDVAKNIGAWW